jgi:hypothetical protein
MKKADIHKLQFIEENKNSLRKIENDRNTTFVVTKRVDLVTTKGINFICKLDELLYYDIIENGTVDPMHDILEGVGPVLMRLMIQEIMNVHNLSIDFVNNRIQNFSKYKPQVSPQTYLMHQMKPRLMMITTLTSMSTTLPANA